MSPARLQNLNLGTAYPPPLRMEGGGTRSQWSPWGKIPAASCHLPRVLQRELPRCVVIGTRRRGKLGNLEVFHFFVKSWLKTTD